MQREAILLEFSSMDIANRTPVIKRKDTIMTIRFFWSSTRKWDSSVGVLVCRLCVWWSGRHVNSRRQLTQKVVR